MNMKGRFLQNPYMFRKLSYRPATEDRPGLPSLPSLRREKSEPGKLRAS